MSEPRDAAWWRNYRANHLADIRAAGRRYYQGHKKEALDRARKWDATRRVQGKGGIVNKLERAIKYLQKYENNQ